MKQQVASSLALADAFGLIQEPNDQKLTAFIQQGVDPDDPAYKFQSGDYIMLLEKLETKETHNAQDEQDEQELLLDEEISQVNQAIY